jgi:hypothetical protein
MRRMPMYTYRRSMGLPPRQTALTVLSTLPGRWPGSSALQSKAWGESCGRNAHPGSKASHSVGARARVTHHAGEGEGQGDGEVCRSPQRFQARYIPVQPAVSVYVDVGTAAPTLIGACVHSDSTPSPGNRSPSLPLPTSLLSRPAEGGNEASSPPQSPSIKLSENAGEVDRPPSPSTVPCHYRGGGLHLDGHIRIRPLGVHAAGPAVTGPAAAHRLTGPAGGVAMAASWSLELGTDGR